MVFFKSLVSVREDDIQIEDGKRIVRVPSDVYEIKPYAFSGLTLDKIVVPKAVNKICTGAFLGCKVKVIEFKGQLTFNPLATNATYIMTNGERTPFRTQQDIESYKIRGAIDIVVRSKYDKGIITAIGEMAMTKNEYLEKQNDGRGGKV